MDCRSIATSIFCAALFGAPALLQGSTLAKTDARFMKMAAQDNMTEAHLGQMAEAQASEESVKDFGKKLSTDHTSAYESLSVLANKVGETIPKGIGRDRTIAQLTHLKGRSFDHAFLEDEVRAHKAAIAEFQGEADHGENPDVKAWAKSMIPTLQGHLNEAEQLEQAKKTRK